MKKNKTWEPKEYVWNLDIDGQEKRWKCLVTEHECITYEGDVERKHLKVMNPVRQEKVLQIDTITTVYGKQTPFQLENGIPYIQLDGKWVMSQTTQADRLEATVKMHQRNSKLELFAGLVFFALVLGKKLISGEVGDWWMLTVFGVFLWTSAIMRMIRLRNELSVMREEAEEEAAAKQQAAKALEAPEETEE